MVVLAVKRGGAKFDFKDALKKAAGGVSGAYSRAHHTHEYKIDRLTLFLFFE
jgi:hypothetical protein